MKRNMISALSAVMALMMLTLTGCGSKTPAKTESANVDLNEVWTAINDLEKDWSDGYFVDLAEDPDMMENYYPGLKDVAVKQLIIRVPMISAAVSEFVLVEGENADAAAAAAKILQQRADDQAAGGAWYPEALESWKQAKVLTNGNYVALIACADHQADAEKAFTAKFA